LTLQLIVLVDDFENAFKSFDNVRRFHFLV
jgi:hypothetical protein